MEPFTVDVPEATLVDLHERLARARLPNQIDGISWEQGTELGYLRGLLEHWRRGYDWRRTEARLNAMPQVVTDVEGQRIHALHVPSANPAALPLVLVHGWPGSVLEFLDVLPLLEPHFHVVAPSLPGFTFSGPTTQRGWHPRRIAAAVGEVVARLGYERYGLQGGDWGSLVTANLADLHPERVVGLHLNMVSGVRRIDGAEVTTAEAESMAAGKVWRRTGVGYQEIQGTRPQSLGYGLEDSPVGLAAWIVEKFREWSHGDIEESYAVDRLLDNITAYWVTGTATSAARIYWEMRQAGRDAVPAARIEVPTAIAEFPGELNQPPRSWTEAAYHVVRWSTPARGGHFAAMEAPEDFAADVRAFFAQLGEVPAAVG
jgi:pimeloyl-ACP methyl ester carboxylesterase